jgi:hypothetical protein
MGTYMLLALARTQILILPEKLLSRKGLFTAAVVSEVTQVIATG